MKHDKISGYKYTGSLNSRIELGDNKLFEERHAKELVKAGWDIPSLFQPNLGLHSLIPPKQNEQTAPKFYIIGIRNDLPWPKNWGKNGISTFQHPSEDPERTAKLYDLMRKFNSEVIGKLARETDNSDFSYDKWLTELKSVMPKEGRFKKLYKKTGWRENVIDGCDHLEKGLVANSLTIVNTDFKDAVTSLEPKKHYFFPYEVRCDDGRVFTDYWIFINLGFREEAVNKFASGCYSGFRDDGSEYFCLPYGNRYTDEMERRLILNENTLVGQHLAIDPIIGADRYIVSAELAAKLEPIIWKNQKPVPVISRKN